MQKRGYINSKPQIVKTNIQIFEEEDDAVRYHGLLQAEDFKDLLTVEEVDLTTVVANCRKYGYSYTIINKDELVIPPL